MTLKEYSGKLIAHGFETDKHNKDNSSKVTKSKLLSQESGISILT